MDNYEYIRLHRLHSLILSYLYHEKIKHEREFIFALSHGAKFNTGWFLSHLEYVNLHSNLIAFASR